MPATDREIGIILTKLEMAKEDRERLESELREVKEALREIQLFVHETKTGQKWLLGIVGIAASLGAVIDRAIAWITT